MWLRIEDREAVRWLVLDRPERRNAVPTGGWEELRAAFAEFEESAQRVLVVTGAGGAFCAGAELDPTTAAAGVADRQRRMKQVGEAALTLHRLTKPTVAAVDGPAVGAGMNLALACDLVIATTRARFAEIFVQRGLTLDFGGSWVLPRVVGLQRAKELALTGRMVEAEEALRIGLCLEVLEPEQLEQAVDRYTAALLAAAPVAQMFAKEGLNRSSEVSLEDALSWEGQSQSICLSTEDVAEGVAAFLEKRQPSWKGR